MSECYAYIICISKQQSSSRRSRVEVKRARYFYLLYLSGKRVYVRSAIFTLISFLNFNPRAIFVLILSDALSDNTSD